MRERCAILSAPRPPPPDYSARLRTYLTHTRQVTRWGGGGGALRRVSAPRRRTGAGQVRLGVSNW